MAEKHVHKVYGSFPPWGKSVEFPASGGGGNYVYFDTSSLNDNEDYSEQEETILKDTMLCYAAIVKYPQYESNAVSFRCPHDCDFDNKFSIYAMGFDFSLKVQVWNAEREEFLLVSLEEAIRECCPKILDLPRLTEEEFYALPAQFTLMYGDEPKTYFYNDGMTWEEWIDSSYNDGNFRISELNLGEGKTFYVEYQGAVVRADVDYDYGYVKPHRQIQSDIRYSRPVGGPI